MHPITRTAGCTLVLCWDRKSIVVIGKEGRGAWHILPWDTLTPNERADVADRYQDWFDIADYWDLCPLAGR